MSNKIKVGWFSFTCCEDNTIIFAELLNTRYKEWLKNIEFVHARFLKQEKSDELHEMDVAFIEGAISSDTQEERLKEIRRKAKILVAVGSCAVIGSPANQRNLFNEKQLLEIKPILEKFKYKDKVLKVADVVLVDESVSGCPMNEKKFLNLMEKLLHAQR